MELTTQLLNSLKIATKKGYILVDPDASDEAKIIILNDSTNTNIANDDNNLIIYGPGDFETNGILVKGSRVNGGTTYSIDSGDGKVLLVQSSSIAKLTDEDEYDAVIVKAVSPVEEASLSAISSRLVVIYGDPVNIPETVKSNKTNKINPKKVEEFASNVVYLEKK